MQIQTQNSAPFNAFAFAGQKYEVRDMVSIFYKASHKKKSEEGNTWVKNLETQLEHLKHYQFSQETLCATLQSQWSSLLRNVIQAIKKFEANYKANCPCSGVLPSPYIKRLNRIQQNANLALFYIEV